MELYANYAMRDEKSRGRLNKENFHDNRGIYERDRDRIIHCEAFRKLEYKTQVFVNHEGDYYRTRLTHTMEVSQIARSMAKRLRLNMELVEAIALAHDLGHTPFGHTGEKVLNRLMEGHGGFEHNRQSYRIVTYLEERYGSFRGLNLSYETLEGIIKHSTPYDKPSTKDLEELFDLGRVPTVEAQLIDYADEIAYLNHDLDDGLESGLLEWDDLSEIAIWTEAMEEARRDDAGLGGKVLKYRTISALIAFFINDLIETTQKNIDENKARDLEEIKRKNIRVVGFSPAIDDKRQQLKTYLYDNLYNHPRVERMRISAEGCLETLFSLYKKYPNILPGRYRREVEASSPERAIADYIAGMTDRFALDEFRRLTGVV
ncbi:deoxyguanosinetriphosphate triphosphohydrolase [Candidatus Mcinerneyibacteriota bacterium]|nr:deoxyguanosinetriphosphate triphosphohydrolase [Candidatus Mcinerneyibacteriota bacterium]